MDSAAAIVVASARDVETRRRRFTSDLASAALNDFTFWSVMAWFIKRVVIVDKHLQSTVCIRTNLRQDERSIKNSKTRLNSRR